ncbi:hypothetical protein ACFQ9R_11800 [Nocardia sp. NPDC056541]|uniref:hypothetical protein n=1 Tax=Nocardia sp. NPDC056541 TaxID=3345860 RepID=UPI00366CC48C
MGTAVDYEIYVRPAEVEHALQILADRAARPLQVATKVLLPDRRQVDLPYRVGGIVDRSFVDCRRGNDLDLLLAMRVDVDEEIAHRYKLFEAVMFTEIEGKFYRYRDDLSADEMVDLFELTAEEQLARGALVTTGTTQVNVRLKVQFASRFVPSCARIRVFSWSTSTHFLFSRSPAFHRIFAELARATDAVGWMYGVEPDDEKIVYWLNGEPTGRMAVPGKRFANLGELADAMRPSAMDDPADH